MKRSLFSLACLVISMTTLSACNPNSNQPPRSSSFGSDGRPAGNNGNAALQGNSGIHGNNKGNGNGNGDSSAQQSTLQQDSTTIAALSLGIPPASQVDINPDAAIIPNSDSLSAPAPSSVPEPTTAIFVGSGICFFIVSRLRKRQEVFDYYNK